MDHDRSHVKAPYNAACTFALQRDVDGALYMLRELAMIGGSAATERIHKVDSDSDFDPVRRDPRFQRALSEIRANLP